MVYIVHENILLTEWNNLFWCISLMYWTWRITIFPIIDHVSSLRSSCSLTPGSILIGFCGFFSVFKLFFHVYFILTDHWEHLCLLHVNVYFNGINIGWRKDVHKKTKPWKQVPYLCSLVTSFLKLSFLNLLKSIIL